MNNLFSTEDVMKITGLKRHHLEYYRQEKIITPTSDKPLKFNYETLLFCFVIKQFKEKMNRKVSIDYIRTILQYNPNLECFNDDSRYMIISDLGKYILVFISKNEDFKDFKNDDKEILKFYEDSTFLDIDDSISGKRMQIIVNGLYVLFLQYAKEHINKMCVDNGYGDKIPSLSLSY